MPIPERDNTFAPSIGRQPVAGAPTSVGADVQKLIQLFGFGNNSSAGNANRAIQSSQQEPQGRSTIPGLDLLGEQGPAIPSNPPVGNVAPLPPAVTSEALPNLPNPPMAVGGPAAGAGGGLEMDNLLEILMQRILQDRFTGGVRS